MRAFLYKRKRVWSLLLAVAMVLGMQGMNVTVSAAKTVSSTGKRAGAEAGFDTFGMLRFADLYDAGKLACKESGVDFDTETQTEGLLISGKNSAVSGAAITVSETFDFGTQAPDRIQVDALSKRATKTDMCLYLDDETKPLATLRMAAQAKDDNWSRKKVYSFDLSGATQALTGKHTLRIQFYDYTTADNKKTSILLRSIRFIRDAVPIVSLNIDETMGSVSDMHNDEAHEAECYGNMKISVPQDYTFEFAKEGTQDKIRGNTEKTFALDYIRGRGNSTWIVEKKPYKIKLDQKADLFGMGANKHWVLLANYYDNSLLRNSLTYYLGRKLGMEYTPECVSVDVVMNNEYMGSYLLCEQIRLGDGRVAENDLEDEKYTGEDISGGYLLSMSPTADETGPIVSTKRNTFLVESPAEGKLVEPAAEYIGDYLQKTEDAIYSSGFQLADGTSYADLMDVASAVSYYWMQEFSMNGDAFLSTSTYLYKKQDTPAGVGKLYWGPLWDFDYVAWSSYNYTMNEESYSGFVNQRSWFARLMEDEAFAEEVKAYWPKFKAELKAALAPGGILEQYAAQLAVSQENNFDLWGFTDFSEGMQNPEGVETKLTYEQEIARLRAWSEKRIEWIDENLEEIAPEPITLTFMVGGEVYAETTARAGRAVTAFPEAPEAPKGKVFAGWYYEEPQIDEETFNLIWRECRLCEGDVLFGDTILTAKFMAEDEIIYPSEVVMERDAMYAMAGMPVNIDYVVLPTDAVDSSVTVTSSDESVVAWNAEEGSWLAVSPGVATITVETKNGKTGTCEIEVISLMDLINDYEKYSLSDFSLEETAVTLRPGDTHKLRVQTMPEKVLGEFRYMSTDSDVVEVKAGVLIAKNPGRALVLVYNDECGVFRFCEVTVSGGQTICPPPEATNPPAADKDKDVQKEKTFGSGKLSYEITKDSGKTHQVAVTGLKKKNSEKKVTIPATVKHNGKSYKVTAVKAGAFAKDKKLTSLIIGKNVTEIGADACKGCKKLKQIQVKTGKLKKVGRHAFDGIKKKAVFKVPAAKYKAYKKLFKGSGKVEKAKK